MNSESKIFVGIDVSKARLDIHVLPNHQAWSTANEGPDLDALVARLAALHPTLIVLEATGGLERRALAQLLAAKLPAVAVNPRQVRDFAKATGHLAKTDTLDAAVLALFAERIRPEVRPPLDEKTQELDALMVRRRQVVDMITAEKTVWLPPRPPSVSCEPFARPSPASRSSSTRSTPTSTAPFATRPPGERRTNCYAPFPASARSWRAHCSPTPRRSGV